MIGQRIRLIKNIDERGMLMAINQIPFEARRMFFISDVPEGEMRGNHFSKTSGFIYVVIDGGCSVCLDDGFHVEEHKMVMGDGLQFSKNTWMKITDFQKNTILCVLSDNEYNAADYGTDYCEFKRIVSEDNV